MCATRKFRGMWGPYLFCYVTESFLKLSFSYNYIKVEQKYQENHLACQIDGPVISLSHITILD